MAQAIRNIKKGQRFIVLSNEEPSGFEVGCLIEAIENVDNCQETGWARFKWIDGNMPWYIKHNPEVTLSNTISELKRFKGKIK